jgi:fumarylacetoacetate (FAA) hydrolase family protein
LWRLDLALTAEGWLAAEGYDGFVVEGRSSMREIGRDPMDHMAQAMRCHRQYPDGVMLPIGTLVAPTEDQTGGRRRATALPSRQATA